VAEVVLCETPRVKTAVDYGCALVQSAEAVTPWRSLNARLDAPADIQLTLFEEPTPDP
jgi:hypothetical protein